MTRLSHIVAVLAFVFALIMGAAGGAMAHVASPDHHGSHHPPTHETPVHGDSHKAALVLVAPCCPAAEAPASHAIAVSERTVAITWTSRAEYVPGARDITPEPPPPKTAL